MREQRASFAAVFDPLTTRRTSLLALGGAAVATLTRQSLVAEAKKNKNKARKKSGKRCEKQGSACQEFATRLCALHHPPSPIRTACENRANACCSSIEQCDAGAYYDCLLEHLEDLEPV